MSVDVGCNNGGGYAGHGGNYAHGGEHLTNYLGGAIGGLGNGGGIGSLGNTGELGALGNGGDLGGLGHGVDLGALANGGDGGLANSGDLGGLGHGGYLGGLANGGDLGGLGNGGDLAVNSGLPNGVGHGANSAGVPFSAGMDSRTDFSVNHGTGGVSVSKKILLSNVYLLNYPKHCWLQLLSSTSHKY